MTFEDVVWECYNTPELVAQFDRLYGTALTSTGINAEVDLATGKRHADLEKFVEFVKEFVWDRLVTA